MSDELHLEFDADALSVEHPFGRLEITEAKIADFCRQVGETNPLYTDTDAADRGPYGSLVAPPSMLLHVTPRDRVDANVRINGTRVDPDDIDLYAGMAIEPLEPLRVGDVLEMTGSVVDIFAKTGRTGWMVFVAHRVEFRNQHGRLAAIVRATVIHRDASGS
ncbi:MAG: MaoC family dehydratase N-terminal domain-containing protein [Planctomycetes bacterium]|nr:MaoC family dehydratase N-terminal domain-containing protein [Planctomycetota bacterium]